jgi:hypothetical protein
MEIAMLDQPLTTGTANGRGLRRHFPKTHITWLIATKAIAYAIKSRPTAVSVEMIAVLNEHGVASLRSGNMAFSIKLIGGTQLDSFDSLVELRTSRDNKGPTYRRFRKALKRCLDRERKVDVRANLQRRKFFEARRRLRALARM